jgi:hypothetical protein
MNVAEVCAPAANNFAGDDTVAFWLVAWFVGASVRLVVFLEFSALAIYVSVIRH